MTELANPLAGADLGAAVNLAATDPLAPAATLAAPVEDPNTFTFVIPGTETSIAIVLGDIPAEVRMDLLKSKVKEYINNNVNQAAVKYKKAMEPWDAYAKAQSVDPLQTAVPKPTGDQPSAPDLIKPAADARARLYSGEIRKQGEPGAAKPTRDPLTKAITDAVVRELFEKRKEAGSKPKWIEVTKEVGDGIAYLNTMIAAKVAAGADAAVMAKLLEEKYMKPAKMLLGLTDNKLTKENSIL